MIDDRQDRLSRFPDNLGERAVHGSTLEHETLSAALAGCDGIATATRDDAFNAVVALAAMSLLDASSRWP